MNHNEIMAAYHAEVVNLLNAKPDLLAQFDELWEAAEYREAYLLIHETVEKEQEEFPDGYTRADEQFYWEFIA